VRASFKSASTSSGSRRLLCPDAHLPTQVYDRGPYRDGDGSPEFNQRHRRAESDAAYNARMPLDPWDKEVREDDSRRPADLQLAVRLLAGSLAFSFLKLFELWSRLGLTWVTTNRSAWIRPITLAASAVLIALLWKGSSWARTLVMVMIAWDALSFLSAAGILFAVGGSRLLGIFSWANLLVELYAGYLLLQEDSLEWFRKQL
jgi:hypothetical protein